ncbi:phosphate ABC transporter substrate-binding protein PstS [Micromonospora sp. CP22]|uniref:phosphate ABC transporter substrate-binding protein PstS n=1 Tax=Micromonospora sp. CP22 TaxID=2580517 RepID=UPI00132A9B41|nr:phosphate ABC transporter substrate-binding protein PstS [Micromonospora sp. CP22]MTK02254.1 phosphate ABC transporter substrate-binding protein PstS [Micromonospora sp. CP22]
MNRNVLSRRVLAGVALVALALTGCGSNDNSSQPGGDGNSSQPGSGGGSAYADLSGELTASGASFPDAYYQEVVEAFKSAAPDVTVTYNATGSGTGKKQFGAGLVDFAGTDSLVKETDGVAAGSFRYVPTVAAPITVSYHLEGVDKLQLSPETLAKIFQTDITTWDDAAIKADNPGVELPDTPITVAHRSDGSGTTSNFTKYLEAAAAGTWKLGSGDTVAWPANTQGGEKNTGVAQIVKQTNGAVGYVDLSDAKATGLTFAAIKNKDGQFVEPSLEGTTAGLEGAEVADDLSYNPLNAAGATAYPITAPTFVIVRTAYDDANKAALVRGFLNYLLTEGQELAEDADFAPLPASLRDKALAQIEKIQG